MKARVAGGYEKVPLLAAVGVFPGGPGEVFCIAPGFREDGGSWLAHLRRRKKRGPEYAGLAVPDARLGIGEALALCFLPADRLDLLPEDLARKSREAKATWSRSSV